MQQTARVIKFETPESAPETIDTPVAQQTPADVVLLFWRRKALLIGTVILVTGFSLLAAFQITPRYTSTARIMIGNASAPPAAAGMLSQALGGGNRTDLYGEIEVMKSDRLIEQMVDKLDIMRDSEFNHELRDGWMHRLSNLAVVRTAVDYLRAVAGKDEKADSRDERLRREVINRVRSSLSVMPPGVSNVVGVSFESIDPVKAMRLTNTFVGLFAADNLDRRVKADAQTRAWLDERIEGLRSAVIESERSVANFLTQRRLVADGRNPVSDRQFADVSRQLTTVKAALAESQTRLAQVYRLRGTPQGLASIKEVRNSPQIVRLQSQEAAMLQKAAEMGTLLGDRHPKMVNIQAEIADIRDRIGDEQDRIVQELENEVRVSRARVRSITDELEDEKRFASSKDTLQLRQLQREAEANQRLYETYLARLKQTGANTDTAEEGLVEIISSARQPLAPSFPKKGLIVGFGFIISLGLGAFLILFAERLDNGFRDPDQVERLTDRPVIGSVPKLASAEKSGHACADEVISAPDSPYGEAIRSLRTGLAVSNVDNPPRVVLVASSLPGEGKSSLSVSLARQAAVSAVNGKVILVDCDLRRPAVSGIMGLRAELGLTELFSGEASFDDVLRTDERTGLHVLPAVPGTPNPPELLNSQHMRDLLVKLSNSYDLVILDSPALDAVSDARVLAHMADSTIFVVEWENTPRHLVLGAMRQLTSAGARIAGVVLHKVNPRKQSAYAYGEPVKA